MFQSLHNVVTKPFRRYNSQEPSPNQASGTVQGTNRNDRLEDGFLLVGQTASEKTTVMTDGFRSDRINPPPSYNEVNSNGGLPTYTDFNSNRSMFSPTLDVSGHSSQYPPHPTITASPTIQTRPHSDFNNDTDRYTSAITDVPFVMAGRFGNQKIVEDLKTSGFLLERRFNMCNYEYDFTLEMSILSEHGELMDER